MKRLSHFQRALAVAAAGAFSEYDFTWFLGTSTQLLYYYLTTTYLLSFTPFLPLFVINATNCPIYDYIVSTVIITESVASVNRDTIDNRNQAWYIKATQRDHERTSSSYLEAVERLFERYKSLAEDDTVETNNALDANDVARMLKVSYRTVLRLAERGELPYFRVGDLWRFERKDVEEFIKRNKQQGKKQDQEK